MSSAFETFVFPILDLFRISCFVFRISACAGREIVHGQLEERYCQVPKPSARRQEGMAGNELPSLEDEIVTRERNRSVSGGDPFAA